MFRSSTPFTRFVVLPCGFFADRSEEMGRSVSWIQPGGDDTTQCTEQHIGHGGKPQAELVGPHGGGGGAVGIEVELALFDPVLHLAACAVDLLVQVPGLAR